MYGHLLCISTEGCKLNDAKTEFIVFRSPRFLLKIKTPSLKVGTAQIDPSEKVKNLGAFFDNCLSMESFVIDKVKTSLFYLKNIRRIRKFLTPESAKKT